MMMIHPEEKNKEAALAWRLREIYAVDRQLEMDHETICPTCLDPYDDENPAIVAKCGHAFHLPCIYEWLERARTCPVCSRTMKFEENTGGGVIGRIG